MFDAKSARGRRVLTDKSHCETLRIGDIISNILLKIYDISPDTDEISWVVKYDDMPIIIDELTDLGYVVSIIKETEIVGHPVIPNKTVTINRLYRECMNNAIISSRLAQIGTILITW
jgi:hypothetical protein